MILTTGQQGLQAHPLHRPLHLQLPTPTAQRAPSPRFHLSLPNVLVKISKQGRGEAVGRERETLGQKQPLWLPEQPRLREGGTENISQAPPRGCRPRTDLLLELSLATNRQGQYCDHFTDEEIKSREPQSLAQVDPASSESSYASPQTTVCTHLVLSVSLSNSNNPFLLEAFPDLPQTGSHPAGGSTQF